jgi:glycosyltransferase involved in cell wall biosynthesis
LASIQTFPPGASEAPLTLGGPILKTLVDARVALVHDWLTGFRGGEKCLEVLCRLFPTAPIYTLLHVRGSLPEVIESHPIRTSFLQRLPRIGRYYRYTLPLMPLAANWRIEDCDLVFSMSHAVAKAAKAPAGVPHVCYCFTPMRYAWHMKESYFAGRFGRLRSMAVDRLMAALRAWDRRTANRVSHFLSNSETVRRRIQESYGRDATVLYPPVDTDFYHPDPSVRRDDFYLVLSAFAPYKRVDLAVEACNRLRRRLVLIGSGQDEERLKSLAGPTVQFLGWSSDEVIRDHLRRCRALLFPGEEDFGIVPVEANACGTPVVAYARGGATETIVPIDRDGATGVWFDEQTIDSLAAAMERLEGERDRLDPAAARRQALRFDKAEHTRRLIAIIENVLAGRSPGS